MEPRRNRAAPVTGLLGRSSTVQGGLRCVVVDPESGARSTGGGRQLGRGRSLDADSWGRKREEMSNGGGSSAGRPRLNLQKRTLLLVNGTDREQQEDNKDSNEDEKKEEQRPRSRSSKLFGAARPRDEVLALKGEGWRKEETKVEKLEIQPRTRSSNPFGIARPREEVLAEKGEDWRKIDEKLEAMKVREAPPERSFGRRGSPVAVEENGNPHLPEACAERAWKKPEAVEAAKESEEGSERAESVLAN